MPRYHDGSTSDDVSGSSDSSFGSSSFGSSSSSSFGSGGPGGRSVFGSAFTWTNDSDDDIDDDIWERAPRGSRRPQGSVGAVASLIGAIVMGVVVLPQILQGFSTSSSPMPMVPDHVEVIVSEPAVVTGGGTAGSPVVVGLEDLLADVGEAERLLGSYLDDEASAVAARDAERLRAIATLARDALDPVLVGLEAQETAPEQAVARLAQAYVPHLLAWRSYLLDVASDPASRIGAEPADLTGLIDATFDEAATAFEDVAASLGGAQAAAVRAAL